MSGLTQRQVIATWYTPEGKMPNEYESVLITMSGRIGGAIFDHVLEIAECADDGCGWEIYGVPENEDTDITVLAWCDIDPYDFESVKRRLKDVR